MDGVRYYAMRIPYSIINELHSREFCALEQAKEERAVNETVDAVGFDFIQPPKIEWSIGVDDQLEPGAFIKINKFESRVRVRTEDVFGGLETLSMVMIDYNYNGDVFDMDQVFYGSELESNDCSVRFSFSRVGNNIMIVFTDIHGNEARHVIKREDFLSAPATA